LSPAEGAGVKYDVFGRSEPEVATIVLSAGLGGIGGFWRPQYDTLAARYRVISYDHRGTGANKEALPDSYTIADMSDDVVAILDQAGIGTCHFMGHALGGLVGLDLALRHPKRVDSLLLVNAWPSIDSHTQRCFEIRLALLEHVGVEAYVRAQPIFIYPSWWLSKHREAIARDDAHGVVHFQGKDTLLKRIQALLRFDPSNRLDQIRVPTLVAAARDDVLVPFTSSEALARGIPNSRLSITPEGGHAFSMTSPMTFNEMISRFLEEIVQA
jgi:aminoacrylate hydrolase